MEPKELGVDMPNRRCFLDEPRVSRSRKLRKDFDGVYTGVQIIVCDDFGTAYDDVLLREE